jgi:iron complex transport system ATP-binding protein
MTGILQVVNARYGVAGRPILNGIDLSVAGGEVVGLVGANGSGKSTLLKTIIGALPGARAGVLVDGMVIPRSRALHARQVAFVEQQAPETQLPVYDIVALGRTPHQGRFAASTSADHAIIDSALQRSGSQPLVDRVFATLSGGERQRVLIARALAQDTPFLLLDEPTNHLDLAAQADIVALIDTIAGEGSGVLLAIHDLTQAAQLCDRIVVIDHGRVLAAGPPRDVLTEALIKEVFGVDARWLTGPGGSVLAIDLLLRHHTSIPRVPAQASYPQEGLSLPS